MRFLADESCDACMIAALRAQGHDVTAIIEDTPGADDATVIRLAVHASRILITEDKDFGQLVFASSHQHGGVILLRYPFRLRHHIATQLLNLVNTRGESLCRSFTVIEPGHTRILPA